MTNFPILLGDNQPMNSANVSRHQASARTQPSGELLPVRMWGPEDQPASLSCTKQKAMQQWKREWTNLPHQNVLHSESLHEGWLRRQAQSTVNKICKQNTPSWYSMQSGGHSSSACTDGCLPSSVKSEEAAQNKFRVYALTSTWVFKWCAPWAIPSSSSFSLLLSKCNRSAG